MQSSNRPNLFLSPQVKAYFCRWVFYLSRTFSIDHSALRNKILACETVRDVEALTGVLVRMGITKQLRVCKGYQPIFRLRYTTDKRHKKIVTLKIVFELNEPKRAHPKELACFVATELEAELHLPAGVLSFGVPHVYSAYKKNGFSGCIKTLPEPLAKNLLKFYRQLLKSVVRLPKSEGTEINRQNMLDELDVLQSGKTKGVLCPDLVSNLAEFFAMVDKSFGTDTSPHDSLATRYARIRHEVENNKTMTAEQLYNKMALSDVWRRIFSLASDGCQIKAIGARIALLDRNGQLIDVMVVRAGGAGAGTCTLIRGKGFVASSFARQQNIVHPRKLWLLCQNPENIAKMQNVLCAFIAHVGGDRATRKHCQSVLLFLSTLREAPARPQIKALPHLKDTKTC